MRRLIIVVALLSGACGSSDTAPTPAPTPIPTPTPVPTSTLSSITGLVTATNGGQPLAGLTAVLGAVTVTTDGAGRFSAQTAATTSTILRLAGVSIVPRSLTLGVSASRDVAVNAIALDGAFDLAYYRELIRNGADAPTVSQPVRRWTRTPQIYLKTVDEGGEAIHGPTLDLIETTIKDAVPRWTGGRLVTPAVTRGSETREGVSGWITIRFPVENTALAGYCGRAQVAVDGGWVELGYHVPPTSSGNCRTTNAVVAPHVVRHEIGHALGFYHTSTVGDLMYRSSWLSPTGFPTTKELSHAAIAYARPVGNVDPDSDPAGTINLVPMTVR